jgi:hypothetical protein
MLASCSRTHYPEPVMIETRDLTKRYGDTLAGFEMG